MWLACLLLPCLITITECFSLKCPVYADNVSHARRDIQRAYDVMDAAAARLDITGSFSYDAAQYVRIDSTGLKGKTALINRCRFFFQTAYSFTGKTVITKIEVHGDQAIVMIKQRQVYTSIAVNRKTGQPYGHIFQSKSCDKWVRGKGGWLRCFSQIL